MNPLKSRTFQNQFTFRGPENLFEPPMFFSAIKEMLIHQTQEVLCENIRFLVHMRDVNTEFLFVEVSLHKSHYVTL